jgi:predicted ABC-type ATPase
MARKRQKPRCIVIAGPNGAGKTTFARDYLPAIAGLIHFVNVDLIAGGISPLRPELAALTAGRVVLLELNRLVEEETDFAFESTLSGLLYARRIQDWKARGYTVSIAYLQLASPQLALSRVAARVIQGGHNVARSDVLRRYKRSWANFLEVYRPLADDWVIHDNSAALPQLLDRASMIARRTKPKKPESFAAGVGRGLRLSAKTARKVARMHGTPVYFWKNGKVVAEKP